MISHARSMGKKPKIQTIPDEIDNEDRSIIDAEDDLNALCNIHNPCWRKLDEDVYEEPVLDIDDADKGGPLAMVEYVVEIYARYKKQEVLFGLCTYYDDL